MLKLPTNPTADQIKAIVTATIRETFEDDATLTGDIKPYGKSGWQVTYKSGDIEFILEWDGNEFTKYPKPSNFSEFEFGAIIDKVLKWNGLDIGVEYNPGQVRFPGRKNSKKLRSGYGHIRNHVGADGEALDCYIYSGLLNDSQSGSNLIFRVTQLADDGDFDEYKFMLGYASKGAAQDAYLQEMPKEFFGGIEAVDREHIDDYRKPSNYAESEVLSDSEWDGLAGIDDASIADALDTMADPGNRS
jgi:hypothetical protein